MRGKRAKIIRLTTKMLYSNDDYMKQFPSWYTERDLYKYLKKRHTRG